MSPHSSKSAKELKPYIGSMEQIARIRTSVIDDGKGRGVRIADVDNGSGLRFCVLLDRGMDIGEASCEGVPFAYMTPVGIANPAFHEPDGLRWLRNFNAGLMTGCGLTHAGAPEVEEGMRVDGPLGLHGRLSNIPAEAVAVSQEWVDGRFCLSVTGIVRQASFFGENLELKRTISTVMGDNSITITDVVKNRGVRPSPLMMLYHINAGFPVLSETAVVEGNIVHTAPRTDEAAKGMADWSRCQKPTPGYAEQCFYHDVAPGADGMARVTLRNPQSGLAMEVAYRKAELPFFTQWKMMGEQEYAMGLEPGNCHPDGQSAEKAGGTLQILAPDASMEFKTAIRLSRS